MTMTASIILEYKIIYFQFPDLTKIHGKHKYPQLQLILNKIKANESSVQSNLGGGIHGHLGLVCIPEDYEEVSPGTPSGRPLILAPPSIPTNTIIHKTQRLQA